MVSAGPVAEASALELTLRALHPYLSRRDVTEVCINQPGKAFLETRTGWCYESLPFATFDWCRRLAKLVANSTRQRIDEESPLLSASLPSGEQHPQGASQFRSAGPPSRFGRSRS
jgi:type IV secretion system protein VirB11